MDSMLLTAAAVGAAAAVTLAAAVILTRRDKSGSGAASRATVAPERRRAVAADTGAGIGPAPAPPEATADEPEPLPGALNGFWLADEHEITAERSTQLAMQLRHVAIPPRGLQHFMSADIMSGDAPDALAQIVMSEPRLAAKVLGRANSPFYGLQSPIASVAHAITYLGMNTVRNMALSFLLQESFAVEEGALGRYCDSVWEAGRMAAELCALLAPRLGFTDTGTLSSQTILAFLGDLAVPSLLGNEAGAMRELDLVERLRFEQERLGASSVLLGTIVIRAWGLPPAIVDAVAAAGRIVVTPVGQSDPAQAPRSALVYACARIGEAIAQQRVGRAEEIALGNTGAPELHYLQGYLRLPQLARLPDMLHAPDTRLALARMIAAVRHETVAG
jgi:HD-like signal output (HDOD) protein